MAAQTFFDPSLSLPAAVTAPPTVQFTPPPGCIDPDDHFVVYTSCYAYSSPDWLNCIVTQFGEPVVGANNCYQGWQGPSTEINGVASYYTGCPSGYTTIGVNTYERNSGAEIEYSVQCCPAKYRFEWQEGYTDFVTVRDGFTASVEHLVPDCGASYIEELSGREIAVRTRMNLEGWEKAKAKRQEAVGVIQWDYERDTMYADAQGAAYTVFYGTHTCYGSSCYDWSYYYFSGSPMPAITVTDPPPPPPTPTVTPTDSSVETPVPTTEVPISTTEIPISTTEIPISTTEIPISTTEIPVSSTETPVPSATEEVSVTEQPSSTTEEVGGEDEPTSTPAEDNSSQATPIPTEEGTGNDLPPVETSSEVPELSTPLSTTTTTTSSGGPSESSSSGETSSSSPAPTKSAAVVVVTPVRLVVLLGLLVSLIAL